MTGVEYLCGPSKRFYLYMFIYTIKRRRKRNIPVLAQSLQSKRCMRDDLIYHTTKFMADVIRVYVCITTIRIFEIIIRASSIKGAKLHLL